MTLELKPIAHPTFELNIPSTNKKVASRPIVTRERKILLTALESEDLFSINRAVKDIISSCVTNVDVNELTTFDFEWIFLQLIINSVRETMDLEVRIPGREDECEECGKVRRIKVNLRDATIEGILNNKKDFIVEIQNGIGLKLKYPTEKDLNIVTEQSEGKSDLERITDLISICIDCIFDDSGMRLFQEFDYKSKIDFLDSLPIVVTDKLEKFVNTLPSLSLGVIVECPKCKFKAKYQMSGLADFFV